MKSSVEPLEGNKVKLYVEVDEAEFDREIDRAFKQIAREVRLPGFRAGKAPRKLLEARIGIGPAREQALRDSIPEFLAKAVNEHGVDLIATPEVEITAGQDDGPVEFDATCEVRPEITVPGYGGLRVELPSISVTDDEIDAAIDTERRQHAGLLTVERPVEQGDYVLLDMNVTRDGEELTGLNPEDWSYEVGQGWVTDDFDDQLVGASAGDRLEFTSTPKGVDEPADFVVVVKQVQELDLPEITDEWVADNLGEFESIEQWRSSVSERIAATKLNQARSMLGGKLTESLALLVDYAIPESMVESDLRSRVERMTQQFQAQGIDLGAWMSATGQDPESFTAGLREQSEEAVKVDLALRAVATAEGIEVDDVDLEAEYAKIAMQVGRKSREVRQAYEQNHAVSELRSQIRKTKALDWLVERAEIVDADGAPIDRELLIGNRDQDQVNEAGNDHDDDENGEG